MTFSRRIKPFGHRNHSLEIKKKKTLRNKNCLNFYGKKHTVDILEKTFHALGTAFISGHKKKVGGQDLNKKNSESSDQLWYLKEEIEKPKNQNLT